MNIVRRETKSERLAREARERASVLKNVAKAAASGNRTAWWLLRIADFLEFAPYAGFATYVAIIGYRAESLYWKAIAAGIASAVLVVGATVVRASNAKMRSQEEDLAGRLKELDVAIREVKAAPRAQTKDDASAATARATLTLLTNTAAQRVRELVTHSKKLRSRATLALVLAILGPAMAFWVVVKADVHPRRQAQGAALDYVAARWTNLMKFLDDPRIPLDNNVGEAGFVSVAQGRRKLRRLSHRARHDRSHHVLHGVRERARVRGRTPDEYLRYAAEALLDNGDPLLPHEWLAAGSPTANAT